ncbi:MAG: sensor domain-containing diguanylate cyclase [Zetaproteobacteria bacterium CG_4_9_14_3_um_filter_54_145]|nr:MAG: sensor domain-containing diguanylate cyclase [Zetaproteobacteria bacterium CG_4_10_14_3_um_filter_54_28]PJA26826.1 MAG: sensor domain-containing diguanylate cyclase [Zetaproteobacteria bacterium CG_4_9_14_3_um_filter_54_145]
MSKSAELNVLTHDTAEIQEKYLLQAVINAVPTPIFFKDSEGRYLGCNRAFEAYTGKTRGELIGKGVYELFERELAQVYFEADKALFESREHQVYEAQVAYADGSVRDVMFHKAVFQASHENVEGIVGAILDITDRKKAEKMYQDMALTDALTGLDNRLSMMNHLGHAFDRTLRSNSSLALLMLDLDNFKEINDSYGHPAGAAFLREAAGRLKRSVRKADVVSRLGGDEFAIILEDITDIAQATHVAEKILAQFAQPVEIDGHCLTMGGSIGIAMVPAHADSVTSLMKHSDIALYLAKAKGKGGYSVYQP